MGFKSNLQLNCKHTWHSIFRDIFDLNGINAKSISKYLRYPSTAAGFAWYVPLGEPRPWRKPLRERQAYAIAMETRGRQGNYESPLRDEDLEKQVGSEVYPEKSTYGHLNSGPSLQVILLLK